MRNNFLHRFFARLLLVLQITQMLSPYGVLQATPSKRHNSSEVHLGLPSRKVFKEVSECWEGLRPPTFIKNTSKISGGSSFDGTIRLVGSQQKTLEVNRKNKAIAESIQFLNNLASPGKALEKMNCSKRMMADMQMFYERGLFKSFNRTILSLGQAMQIGQFYQGASCQKEAEERRDFITGLLVTPDAARAIGVRIRCFGKYENQFLRQTMTLRNESLEQKIKALEPSKLFGPLRNSPAFLRWHARITENPFFETLKNAYMLFAAYTLVNLFFRSFVKSIPAQAKDYALSGGPLTTIKNAASNVTETFSSTLPDFSSTTEEHTVKQSVTLSAEQKHKIKYDITREMADNLRKNMSGARYDIAYQMGQLFLGSKTRQGLLKETAKHITTNLRATAGGLGVGPLQFIPVILQILKKQGKRILNRRKIQETQSNRAWVRKLEEVILKGCEKKFSHIPSLSAQTWEDGLDLLSTFPDLLAATATDLVEKATKSGNTRALFWDGDPKDVKATTAMMDLFNFLNPIRSMLDHGNDNKKAFEETIHKVRVATNKTAGDTAEHMFGDERAFHNPLGAAAEKSIPGLKAVRNASLDPLKWIFGTRAMNILYGNIPYIGWMKILTGNISAYTKEAKLAGSFVFNGVEAAANMAGAGIHKTITTVTDSKGKKYNVSFAPGFVDILTGLNTALGKKELPSCALFCVSTTGEDGKEKFLTHEELSGDLLKEVTEYLQTETGKHIKETLAPQSLKSENIQKNYARLKTLKKQLEEQTKKLSPEEKELMDFAVRFGLPLDTTTLREAQNYTRYLSRELQAKVSHLLANPTEAAELTAKLTAVGATQRKIQKKSGRFDTLAVFKLSKHKQLTSRIIEANIGWICLLLAFVYTCGNLKYHEKNLINSELDSYMFSSLKPAVALSEMVRQITHILNKKCESIPLPQSLKTKLTMLVATATPNCKTFNKLARNKMFLNAKKPALFGDYGTLRYAYKLTAQPDVKRWLSICATFIAEIDSYLAIARLVAEHKNAPNYFYPITFLNQEAPRVELSGFWLPLIGAYKSIPNDLIIGDPAHILITGLNGGGKSFALKGLLFTILMSHAFGYGPVKKGSMTFFNKIITHLSTTDNAAEGDSCWIAEAKSMGNAIHAMQAPHATGDRILYIGDELGSGTASAASIQAVASLMDIALDQPHVASIITTHLRPLTELEYLTNGKVHNYRVGGTVSAEGVIQRKFQLERGRANLNIAELIVNQLLEHGEQKTLAPNANPAIIQPTEA